MNHEGATYDCLYDEQDLQNRDAVVNVSRPEDFFYQCCRCKGFTVPLDDDISTGCEEPTCAYINHEGDIYPCRYNQQHLINNDSVVDPDDLPASFATCCRCNGDTVPLDGIVADGCEEPTCGFMNHEGAKYDCLYDEQDLQNHDAVVNVSRPEDFFYQCCRCKGDTVPLDDDISTGCEEPTCAYINHEGDIYPCRYNQQHLINNDSVVDPDDLPASFATCCRCNGDTVPLDGIVADGCEEP